VHSLSVALQHVLADATSRGQRVAVALEPSPAALAGSVAAAWPRLSAGRSLRAQVDGLGALLVGACESGGGTGADEHLLRRLGALLMWGELELTRLSALGLCKTDGSHASYPPPLHAMRQFPPHAAGLRLHA
jgi:hypothetical protein